MQYEHASKAQIHIHTGSEYIFEHIYIFVYLFYGYATGNALEYALSVQLYMQELIEPPRVRPACFDECRRDDRSEDDLIKFHIVVNFVEFILF